MSTRVLFEGSAVNGSVALRFSAIRVGTTAGVVSFSSSESRVRSMTPPPPRTARCEAVTDTDLASPRYDGESSRFTWPSSSSSSSESRMTMSTLDAFFFELSVELLAAETNGLASATTAGLGATATECEAFHAGEACLLSVVCHSPSASTVTSSTLLGSAVRISRKYLYLLVSCGRKLDYQYFAHPSMIKSSGSKTLSQVGHNQVDVCSIVEYHISASKHCGCTHFEDRLGDFIRM